MCVKAHEAYTQYTCIWMFGDTIYPKKSICELTLKTSWKQMLLGTVMSRMWWAQWKILRGKMRTTPRFRWTIVSSMPIPPSRSPCSSSYKRLTWTRTTSTTTALRSEIRKEGNETLYLLFNHYIYQMFRYLLKIIVEYVEKIERITSLIMPVFVATGSGIMPLFFIMWISQQFEMSSRRYLYPYGNW